MIEDNMNALFWEVICLLIPHSLSSKIIQEMLNYSSKVKVWLHNRYGLGWVLIYTESSH